MAWIRLLRNIFEQGYRVMQDIRPLKPVKFPHVHMEIHTDEHKTLVVSKKNN